MKYGLKTELESKIQESLFGFMFILNITYYLKVFNISKGNNKIKAINKIEFNQCSG